MASMYWRSPRLLGELQQTPQRLAGSSVLGIGPLAALGVLGKELTQVQDLDFLVAPLQPCPSWQRP